MFDLIKESTEKLVSEIDNS